jgi:CubicO group peptidase (beta-lactamase class C family)
MEAAASLGDRLEALRSQLNVVGVAVGYRDENGVDRFECSGLAHLDPPLPMSPDSVHELASISKTYTAVGILRMVERGVLSLDTRIRDVIPELRPAGITVRDLLTHTHGLADYLEPNDDLAQDVHEADLLVRLRPKRLRYRVGGRCEYSNTGYWLLGILAARVRGGTFADFLVDEVIRPAGLLATFPNDPLQPPPARLSAYTEGVPADPTCANLSLVGDGGVLASTRDLLAWDRAVFETDLLTPATRDLMLTPTPQSLAADDGYGMGWVVATDSEGHRTYGHDGGWSGTATSYSRRADGSRVVVALANSDHIEASDFAKLV